MKGKKNSREKNIVDERARERGGNLTSFLAHSKKTQVGHILKTSVHHFTFIIRQVSSYRMMKFENLTFKKDK